MRKHYIDNIRWISILLLFIYHTCMIWNNFGDEFYIWGGDNQLLSGFILFLYPVYMPLLFTIAGISSKLALKKRSYMEYTKERVLRLLVPFVGGVLLIVPVQTFYAEKFHNAYKGGYIQQYKLFFTKITDLSGYQGGLTPGHLWFIWYLFIISLIAIIIISLIKKSRFKIDVNKISLSKVIALFIIICFSIPILEIGGKSVGKFLMLFLLGYYVLSNDAVMDKIEENRYSLLIAFIIVNSIHMFLFIFYKFDSGLLYNGFVSFAGWLGILAILGIGKHSMDFSNRLTNYFAISSFPIYIIHQTVLVMIAYYVMTMLTGLLIQFSCIAVGSFLVTMVIYEIIKRIPYIRILFGIKVRLKI